VEKYEWSRGRGRDPQNCGIFDTVRGMRPPPIRSCWDTCRSIHTAPVVQDGRRCVDSCLSGSSVVLRSRNDHVLPPFDHISLQNPIGDCSSRHQALPRGMSIALILTALCSFSSYTTVAAPSSTVGIPALFSLKLHPMHA